MRNSCLPFRPNMLLYVLHFHRQQHITKGTMACLLFFFPHWALCNLPGSPHGKILLYSLLLCPLSSPLLSWHDLKACYNLKLAPKTSPKSWRISNVLHQTGQFMTRRLCTLSWTLKQFGPLWLLYPHYIKHVWLFSRGIWVNLQIIKCFCETSHSHFGASLCVDRLIEVATWFICKEMSYSSLEEKEWKE